MCEKILPIAEFYVDKRFDIPWRRCKKCFYGPPAPPKFQDTPELRECSKCGEHKTPDEFYFNNKWGLPFRTCKECQLVRERNRRESGGDIRAHRLRKYGLTPEDYDEMLERQSGVCAICGLGPSGRRKEKYLHVDHCHKSGTVRGLLCQSCNIGIGLLKDNPELLIKAVTYLSSEVEYF